MLKELRGRVVDVETGTTDAVARPARKVMPVRPAGRAPQASDRPAVAKPRSTSGPEPARRPVPAHRPTTPPVAGQPSSTAPEPVEPVTHELLGADELLYLGELDLAPPRAKAEGTRGPVPWARGMRG